MLDSERTFKIKVKSRRLHQQLFAFKRFCVETRLSNTSKTLNFAKLNKNILESYYRVLQGISKWKTLKQAVYFLRVVDFWLTFDIHIDITLAIFCQKLQSYTF